MDDCDKDVEVYLDAVSKVYQADREGWGWPLKQATPPEEQSTLLVMTNAGPVGASVQKSVCRQDGIPCVHINLAFQGYYDGCSAAGVCYDEHNDVYKAHSLSYGLGAATISNVTWKVGATSGVVLLQPMSRRFTDEVP
jgi:hypothetical protein